MYRPFTKYIVVHHTAELAADGNNLDLDIDTAVRRIRNGHIRAGLAYDGNPAYHVVISGNKGLALTRPLNSVGYHSGGRFSITNWNSIAVCLVGNFQREEPTAYQKSKLGDILTEWQKLYGIPRENIKLHRDIKATACPGLSITDQFITEAIEAKKEPEHINVQALFNEIWGVPGVERDYLYFIRRYELGTITSRADMINKMRYWASIVRPDGKTVDPAGDARWQREKNKVLSGN